MKSPLDEGKEVAFTIRGNSMWPLLHSGRDKIYLKKLDFYKKYDIILYKRNNGSFVLHRIVGKKKGAFVLAGDGEFHTEYPIHNDQIVAGAVSGERNGKPFDCNNFFYKMYSRFWVFILPFRPVATRIYAKLRRRVSNVFKK